MVFIKIKRYIVIVLVFVCVLSFSAFADFSSTDSTHLTSIYTKTNTIASAISTYLPDISSIKVSAQNLTNLVGIKANTGSIVSEISGLSTIMAHLDARTTSENRGLCTWINLMAGRMLTNGYTVADSGYQSMLTLSDIFDLLNADKDKQEDALADYSTSGGRSASNTSADVGAISGSLSNSFNSGVSASSALNAVDDNQSDFQYFFFGMTNDLNTSSGSAGAPSRGAKSSEAGTFVPDFLSDYWEGLNG